MLMGFDPAVTQVAYRIGDSITNPLSPLFPYCPVILGFVRRYAPEMGLGSVIANMVPFSVTFTVIWIIQLGWALLSPTWCRFPLLLRLSGLSSFWCGFSSTCLWARAAVSS